MSSRDARYTADLSSAPPDRVKPTPAKLVVVSGPDEGREFALEGSLEIGREPDCGLVMTDLAVSRRHAVVTSVGGRFTVRDIGSRTGTFVGDARVVEAEVQLGAVIRIGNSAIAIHPRWHVREVSPSLKRSFGQLLGESVGMREVFAILERVSASDVSVLIEGETGTGKEVTARSIHEASPRASRPYVVFDCGSVPRDLAESELFGHKRGAFSGAIADRAGAFSRAHGGTLCLDEIGELPLDLQPRLLRVLETGEIKAVGDDVMRKVDVRVIAATNRDLRAEARRGTFREDLLYRLDVVRVRMPPLRHRPEDVAHYVKSFLHGRIAETPVAGANLERLLGYTWPGNVRELRNTLMRAVALAPRGPDALPRFDDLVFNLGPASSSPITLGMSFPGVAVHVPYKDAKEQLLSSFERAYVEALLERHSGNLTRASAAAGLSRKHLSELVRRVTGQSDDPSEAV